jgi:hypothetical protein
MQDGELRVFADGERGRAAAILDRKARRLKWAMGSLVAAVVLVAAGMGLH